MNTFWQDFKKPIKILAPMENVTDTVFRRIITTTGRPDVFFTEFTSTDAICSEGLKNLTKGHLLYSGIETPLIVQIWGTNPDKYFKAAKIVKDMGFSGIDINMGCPVHAVIKRGSCGGLIKTPELAKEIVMSVQKAVGDSLPISVKTRLGFHDIQTNEWIEFLLKLKIDALTVHLRTVKEMSKVPAHWEEMEKIIKLRDRVSPRTIIIGNGDLTTKEQINEVFEKYKVDGVMIGRGIFHDPWIFNTKIKKEDITLVEKLELLIQHISLFQKTWGDTRPHEVLKRFYKIYVSDFHEAGEFRMKLMETKSLTDSLNILEQKIKEVKNEQN